MKREEVLLVVSDERDYQEEMKARENRPDMIPDLHIGDTLTAIHFNVLKSQAEWYKGSVPHENAMHYLRKVAALCVQAGEDYGMPPRSVEDFKEYNN